MPFFPPRPKRESIRTVICQEQHSESNPFVAEKTLRHFEKNAFQDSSHESIDMVEVFKKSTVYSALVINFCIADNTFRKAIRVALTGKRDPVYLSLSSDIMAESLGARGKHQ